MSNYLEYKGYFGTVEYSSDDELLFGKVQFIDSLLAYDGKTTIEIKLAFEETIDSYLEFCREANKSPEKTFNGTFNVRIGSELHRKAAKLAFSQGSSLNEFTMKALETLVNAEKPKIVKHIHTHFYPSVSALPVDSYVASTDKPLVWEAISGTAH